MITVMKSNNDVHVFIDSRSVGLIGLSDTDYLNQQNLPIWQIKGLCNTFMVSSDDLRASDIIRAHEFDSFEINLNNVLTKLVPAIRALLGKYLNPKQKPVEFLSGCYLLIHDNNIYKIDSWFGVEELSDIAVIGQYENLCEGLLLQSNQDLSPKEKVTDSYEILEAYTNVKAKILTHYIINGIDCTLKRNK